MQIESQIREEIELSISASILDYQIHDKVIVLL